MAAEAGYLVVQRDGQTWATLALNTSILTIGRAPDNSLPLPDPRVSRHHAELRLEPEGAMLTDLGSSNGTFVDSTRLLPHQPHLLTLGTAVRVGPFVLLYQASEHLPEGREEGLLTQQETQQQVAAVTQARPPDPIMTARPAQPTPPAQGPSSTYLRDLPIIFHDNDFLGRFLLIFESIWELLEQRQDHIEMYFDPKTCPASFLCWLTSWLGLSFYAHWPETRVRHLLAEAMDLYRWRGTHYGLVQMIRVCTGLTAHITEEPDQPFVIRIQVPGATRDELDLELLERLVLAHKPAHAGYILDVSP